MSVQSMPSHEIPRQTTPYADRISYRGRALTIIVFTVAILLLLITLAWIAAQRADEVFVRRGDAAFSASQFGGAIDQYSWAIRFNADDAHALLSRGYAYQQLNDDIAAIRDFDRYVALRPDNASGYVARARSHVILGQTDAAIADFSSALANDPNNVAAIAGRARAYAIRADWQLAANDMRRALTLRPDNVGYLLDSARYHLNLALPDLALRDVDSAITIEPNNISALKLRARLRQQRGDLAGAASDIAQARAALPTDLSLALTHGRVLFQQGKIDEALALYTAFADADAPAEVFVQIGRLHYQKREYRAALEHYQAALDRDSADPAIYKGIALSQRKLGDPRAAIAAFRTYLQLAPNAPDRAAIELWIDSYVQRLAYVKPI